MTSCPRQVSVHVRTLWPKASWGGKGLFDFRVPVHPWKKPQAQELRQRPCWDSLYWLSFHDLVSLLFDTIQDHLPRGGTVHRELGLPTSIPNQENAPQPCPQASLEDAVLLVD